MKFASITNRIAGASTDAWEIHHRGQKRLADGEDVIMLSIGEEPDKVASETTVDAAINSLRNGRQHYTPAQGLPELRERIAEYHYRMTGQRADATQCTVHSGAQNALFAISQCLLESGDEVILSEPYYTTYPATFTASGAKAVSLPVKAANGFLPDPAEVLASITPSTRAIVLNSPSNPLGSVYTAEQYQPILAACIEKKIWLVSDEVYAAMVPREQRVSPAGMPGAENVCVTICSLSKSHRMTGWRIGWSVTPPELAKHVTNLSMCMHYGLPPFTMDAAIAALKDEHTPEVIRQSMQERRAVIHDTLATGEQITLHDSGAGMFVLLHVESTGKTAKQFASELLDQQNVSTLPCDGFGPAGKYLIRVGLCVDVDRLDVACKRINKYIQTLN